MSKQGREFDHRKSFRYPVSDRQRDAELKVRRRRLPVCLGNESSGGFAAWVERDPRVEVGDVLELLTATGRFQVRVAHCTQILPKQTDREKGRPVFRIGLERLSELDLPPSGQGLSRGLRNTCSLSSLLPSGTTAVAMLTLMVLGGAMGAIAALSWADGPIFRPVARWAGTADQPAPPTDSSLANVVQRVGLTETQRKQLQEVSATTAETLQQLDRQWMHDRPEERARKQAMVMNAAHREVLSLLTPEQRARWKRFLD